MEYKRNVVIYTAEQIVRDFDVVRRMKDGTDMPVDTACVMFDGKGNLIDANGLLLTAKDCADKINCGGYEVIYNNGRYCLMLWDGVYNYGFALCA